MRKTIVILICSTVVLLLGYAGYRGYELWKQNHWMALAKSFAAKNDAHNEFLCLEQVLHANGRNVQACRMMANLAEASGSPAALTWRKEVVDLDPGSSNDRLALAQTAIMAHDYSTAQAALAGMDADGKGTAGYYNVSATLALAMNQLALAESDFAEAARLDPANPAPQLSLAVIQLHGTNSLDQQEARITLKRISMTSTNMLVRSQAQRELVMDAAQSRDYQTALGYSSELLQQANVPFSDKLLRLDVLRVSGSGEYGRTIASTEQEAATDSGKLEQLATWMESRNLPKQGLNWLQSLPANVQTNPPAGVYIAQCQILTQNWDGLRNSLPKESWGNLDFTRHAYLAYALRQQGLYEASKAEWDVALHAANGQDLPMTGLYHLAVEWKWSDEAEQILSTIVSSFPEELWASRQLTADLYASGSTRPLMQLFSTQANRNPNDLDARNDLALTAMLLRAQEMNPYDIARDVYQKSPTNSYFACTYAFSLYLQGKNSEAMKVMQQLSPAALKNNSTDGYYGLVLMAAGDKTDALAYLNRSIKGPLLPEERAMFQQALSRP
ncbi:MAG: hypothetical protein ACLQSR_00620 [Limisphaerales bacterium]